MNKAHSVSARLLQIAKARNEDFHFVLVRYGSERLLYRIGMHPLLRTFLLKGASLFLVWEGTWFRTTRDIDLLGFGNPDMEYLKQRFQDVCSMDTSDEDGLVFDRESLTVTRIKEDQFYEGIRVRLVCLLEKTRIPLQVDIGFGDAVTPAANHVEYPCLLDAPPPRVNAYPMETVVSEKFLAIATLGMSNTRMKDYFDLAVLGRRFPLDAAMCALAIRNTCHARKIDLPKELPIGLTDRFGSDIDKVRQWNAFTNRSGFSIQVGDLASVVQEVRTLLDPILDRLFADDAPA